MHEIKKRIFSSVLLSMVCISLSILATASFLLPQKAYAGIDYFLTPKCTSSRCVYTFLTAIPGISNKDENTGVGSLDLAQGGASEYLKRLYIFGISIASVLAVIMITYAGVKYATAEAITGKSDAKSIIQEALTGLGLALISYTLLNTINPNLVRGEFSPGAIDVTPGSAAGQVGGGLNVVNPETPPTNPDGSAVKQSEFIAEWQNHARTNLQNSSLLSSTPSDASDYFPNGESDVNNPENWIALLSSMTKRESGFDPNQTYTENFKDNSGNYVVSTGLLQISQESARGYGFPNITTEDLKNPQKNIEVGVAIMQKLVKQDGCISCKDPATGEWRGAARYWAVLRNDSNEEIKKELKGD